MGRTMASGRRYKELTTKACDNARPGERVAYWPDRGPQSVPGLRLCVRPEGAKLWMLRYKLPKADAVPDEAGRVKLSESTHGLGRYPEVSLAEARERARRARKDLAEGRHPGVAKRSRIVEAVQSDKRTFEAVAGAWVAQGERYGYHAHRDKGTRPWSAHHAERNRGLIRRFLTPTLGSLPVAAITEDRVLDALRPAYEDGRRESARRAVVIARQVLGFAKRRKWIASNPLTTILENADMPKPQVRHFAALRQDQIGPLMRAIRSDTLGPITRPALLLMLYTGLRDGALRGARWNEIDLDAATWTVPAERMKSRREHRLPLPSQAVVVLTELAKLTRRKPDDFVFAGNGKAGYLAENSLRLALHRLGFNVTAHGIRSLLTDALNLQGHNPDWIERQLDHVMKDKVRASYLRTDFYDQRRAMMQGWADRLEAEAQGAAIVPIKRKSA